MLFSLVDSMRRPIGVNNRKPSVTSSIASEDSVGSQNEVLATVTANGQLSTDVGSTISPSPILPNKPSIVGRLPDSTGATSVLRTSVSSTTSNSINSFGYSRGPSPLTLGLSEVIPLAVAFQEVCHACFRGPDESQVQVRLIGDLMVSFPAGIVSVIANNVNPAPLQFRICNSNAMESIVPNKELISVSTQTQSFKQDPNSKLFEFNMKSLQEMLKQQSEINPGASYFNIDILKYQVGY